MSNILNYCGLNDVYFKKLLKENKEVLPKILEGICGINVSADDIVMQSVEIQDEINLKTTRFDVSISICNLRIDLESENAMHGDRLYYDNRKLYYLARLHASSYKKINYNELNKSYVIFLYNFNMGYDNLITESVMVNKSNMVEYPHLKVYDIDLSKVDKSSKIEVERLFDLLRRKDIEEYLEDDNPFLKGVANMIETYDKDEILRLQAQLREDNEMELRSMKIFARKEGLEEGRREGLKEGLKEGRQEGRQEGRKEGIKEGLKAGLVEGKKEIAKKMLEDNMPLDIIEKYSGLSIEEINKLK